MLTEKMTYTVSAVTPNTQVGDIVYVKELDSGAHAIGEVDRIYAHGVHMDLYMAKRVSENTFEVSRRLYPEFFNMQPVLATGTVRNTAGVLILEGKLTTRLHGVCDRCAREFQRDVFQGP